MTAGETFYLINFDFWRNWRRHSNYDRVRSSSFEELEPTGDPPEKIRNDKLLREGKLKRFLNQNFDYYIVNETVWKLLYEKYGGGPEIPRMAIQDGRYVKIEVYPPSFKIMKETIDGEVSDLGTITVSMATTVGEAIKVIKEQFTDLPEGDVLLWHYFMKRKYKLLKDLDTRLRGAGLYQNDTILISFDPDETPSKGTSTTYSSTYSSSTSGVSSYYTSGYGVSSYSSSYYSSRYQPGGKAIEKGVTGLRNLGNTCFMNSGLQCLMHTVPLVNYFNSKEYLKEINVDNPIGMGGKLAKIYGELMNDYWNGGYGYIVPSSFKTTIGQFAPQFVGYDQQDSQELIGFLLDGLHEDLNRILKKPPTEQVKGDDTSNDLQLAADSWKVHLTRNDSFIVDKFLGQTKSRLVCPTCKNVSVTFDPIMYMPLPMPSTLEWTFDIIVVPLKGKKYITTVTSSKSQGVDGLKVELSKKTGIENFVLAEVWRHKIHGFFNDSAALNDVRSDEDIYAFEVNRKVKNSDIIVQVHHRKLTSYQYYSGKRQVREDSFGVPSILVYPVDEEAKVAEDVYNIVDKYVPELPVDETTEEMEERRNLRIKQKEELKKKKKEEELARKERGKVKKEKYLKKKIELGEETEQRYITIAGNQYATAISDYSTDDFITTSSDSDDEEDIDVDNLIDYWDFEPNLKHPPYKVGIIPKKKYFYSVEVKKEHFTSKEQLTKVKKGLSVYVCWNPNVIVDFDKEILEKMEEVEGTKTKRDKVKQTITLDQCFTAFSREEILTSENTWYCNHCKEHVQATKKVDFWKLPEVLVIHLKRFLYGRYQRSKINTFIDCPLEIDLSDRVLGPTEIPLKYKLYAVSNHYGDLGGGHYTAFALNPKSNKWYEFDDSSCSEKSSSGVITSAAYVLFYRRENESNIDPLDESKWKFEEEKEEEEIKTTKTTSSSDSSDMEM